MVGMPRSSRCTTTSAWRPSSGRVPSVCGKERWMVHVTKNARATAITRMPATTRKAMRPIRAARGAREGAADSGESVVIVENSFGWHGGTQSQRAPERVSEDALWEYYSHRGARAGDVLALVPVSRPAGHPIRLG